MATSIDQETRTSSTDPEVPKRPTVWSFLGNVGAGILSLGWVALWLFDAGTCELEGIIWTCQKGVMVTEVNVVIAAFLVIFGIGALLRGVVGLASGAWKEPDKSDQVNAPVGPPPLP